SCGLSLFDDSAPATEMSRIDQIDGHQSWSQQGDRIVADIYDNATCSPYIGKIVVINPTDGSIKAIADHHCVYSIEPKEIHHPHAVFSPDATKIVYNSDNGGRYGSVYVVRWKKPAPPQALSGKRSGNTVALTWKAPVPGKEIRRFAVYRQVAGVWETNPVA